MADGTRLGLKLSSLSVGVFPEPKGLGSLGGWSERGVAGAWSRTFPSSERLAVVGSNSPILLFEEWGTDSGASWTQ